MTIQLSQRSCGLSAAAAWLVLGCASAPLQAQESPAPAEPPPASTETPGAEPAVEPQDSEHPGHPREASVGGSERKVPDHAGLFPNSPLSFIVPPIKEAESWISEKARLDLGFRLAFFFQQATGGAGERTTAAQDYRAYGTFHAINFKPEDKGWAGNVYFRAEYRDKMFTDITPYELNTQIGTLFTTAYGQDEHDLAMVQLYYEQFLFDGALRARVGKLDPDDYFNLGRFADDYRYFSNTLFSAFPASNHPSGGLGWNLQWYVTPEWTITAGMTDVRGRKVWPGWETVNEGKFISAIDLTFSPKINGLQGNYRIGIEHRDSFPDEDRPQDNSYYLNIDQEIAKDIAPFLRIGYGTGNSTGVEAACSIGLGIDNPLNRPGDAFGIGIGFDTPPDDVDAERDAEYAGEVFYRFQVTHAMQWTFGGQLILEPVNAPDDDVVGVFESRLVIDF